VTEIDLQLRDDWVLTSLQPLSVLIDISRIVSMKISSDNFYQYHQNTWMDISILINRAHNLSSLIIQNSFNIYESSQTIQNTHSILPRHIKHLQIPINHLNQIQMILKRCKNLATINFDIADVKFCKEVIQWFADNTINTSCQEGYKRVTVWLGKKNIQSTELNRDSKRIKLTNNCSD
jgi:hypothetical protein